MPDPTESPTLERAEEILVATDQHGNRTFDCVVDGERAGIRIRNAGGVLTYECEHKHGRKHGVEREWDEDGSLAFESHWVGGKEHGVARQWRRGKLLGAYEMDHGTGVDLWRDCDGALQEERHYLDGAMHGFERWWRDGEAVWEEGHYKRNVPHGILRRWNERGRLRRGYPQYFVDGKQVTKRQYVRACASDPSLPPFDEADNRPERPLPEESSPPTPSPLR